MTTGLSWRWVRKNKGDIDRQDVEKISRIGSVRSVGHTGPIVQAFARQHIPCPRCGQVAKEWCKTSSGNYTPTPHAARMDLARTAVMLWVEVRQAKKRRKVT